MKILFMRNCGQKLTDDRTSYMNRSILREVPGDTGLLLHAYLGGRDSGYALANCFDFLL